MFDALQTILKDFGPYVALVVFFIYRDYSRENRQTAYIEHLVANVVEIASRYNLTTQAIIAATNKSTKATQRNCRLLEQTLLKDVGKRPTEEIYVNDESEDNLHADAYEPLVHPNQANLKMRTKHKEDHER